MTHELITAFAEFLDSGRWLKVLLFLTGLMILTILIQIQRGHNRIDFKDILVDENGKASPTKIFQTGCFLTSTWGFIVLADAGTLQEWFFNGYILLWSATRLATKMIDQKFPAPPPIPTATATATATGAGASATVSTPAAQNTEVKES